MSLHLAARVTELQEEDQPDVAAAVAFLASEESGKMAGASVSVNGGTLVM